MAASARKKIPFAFVVGGLAIAALVLGRGGGGHGLTPVEVIDVQAKAANAHYKSGTKKRRSFTDWEKVTGITLHQVGVRKVGRKAYPGMTAHLGVHHDGTIYVIHPLNTLLWHGHGFNRDTVSIEVAGLFGINTPLPPAQANGLRQAIRMIQQEVARQGGRISFIYAHRQSSAGRALDPQKAIWQQGAIWAEQNLGINTVPFHTRGTGKPITAKWDPRLEGKAFSGAFDDDELEGMPTEDIYELDHEAR